MSIERLPHKYPIECTDGGQVQFSFGLVYTIWSFGKRVNFLSQLFFDFYKKFCYNNYRRNEKGEFSNDARSAGCHSGVLHEPRFLQELSNGPVLLENAM